MPGSSLFSLPLVSARGPTIHAPYRPPHAAVLPFSQTPWFPISGLQTPRVGPSHRSGGRAAAFRPRDMNVAARTRCGFNAAGHQNARRVRLNPPRAVLRAGDLFPGPTPACRPSIDTLGTPDPSPLPLIKWAQGATQPACNRPLARRSARGKVGSRVAPTKEIVGARLKLRICRA
jgi:hypothetical protein